MNSTLYFAMASVVVLGAQAQDNAKTAKFHALLKADWEWRMKEYPEFATALGDHRFNERLTDMSLAAIQRRAAYARELLGKVQGIERRNLTGQDLVSFDLFLYDARQRVGGQRFPSDYLAFSQMDGPHLALLSVAESMPFRSVKDYRDYLARLRAYPGFLAQVTDLLKEGMRTGWMAPKEPLRSAPAQIADQMAMKLEDHPLYAPAKRFPANLPSEDQKSLEADLRNALTEAVFPALRSFLGFARDTYLPACRTSIAASQLPDGEAFYAYMVQTSTTTSLSPKAIHELGVSEVARIRKEMEHVIGKTGFKGSFQEFQTFLRTDPRFYFTTADELGKGYRDLAKRIDFELPKLFAELPRLPYGVREIPSFQAPAETTARYGGGAADGSRAGTFWYNTYKLETRPKFEMEALTLHEGVPGHHLQIARAQELKGLPEFRRNGGYDAYVEGWGLYAESLGSELGLYQDPYSRFGQLSFEMWRACRLVVDTGMHAFGWSRQQAIDYMKANTAKTENDIIVEVDRYIVWPGQALAYKIGELKIKELRARAERSLGAAFDLRRFHNALLDNGPLPLEVLERQIEAWIKAEQKSSPSDPTL